MKASYSVQQQIANNLRSVSQITVKTESLSNFIPLIQSISSSSISWWTTTQSSKSTTKCITFKMKTNRRKRLISRVPLEREFWKNWGISSSSLRLILLWRAIMSSWKSWKRSSRQRLLFDLNGMGMDENLRNLRMKSFKRNLWENTFHNSVIFIFWVSSLSWTN